MPLPVPTPNRTRPPPMSTARPEVHRLDGAPAAAAAQIEEHQSDSSGVRGADGDQLGGGALGVTAVGELEQHDAGEEEDDERGGLQPGRDRIGPGIAAAMTAMMTVA